MNQVIINGADDAPNRVLFAHGAGAGMEHADMTYLAESLADEHIQVIRFEFPYMQKTRADGRRRPPDREPILLDYWRERVREFAHPRLFLAGKSMGGRMASLIIDELADELKTDELSPAGLLLLGFPFTPPNKPDKYRGAHLATLRAPTLLLQGERDAFGNKEAVQKFELSPKIHTHWLKDGDHSFKPRKASGTTLDNNLREVVAKMRNFIVAG
ncbi:alpha/beta fold hydrolase [Oceanisphaera pacifica]|uniref:Alpha/beta hydrolase n=1 Tax=Oceanisphaera pacifica TaxID=2818389 RepID=A0ABS3NJ26_9GAMM|nr:alpha/beta family hydrolase [Oceanisphaera pacifica]MBO1520587.1 alpha/beta hydrolase [Oceanisphaera pacifica]